MTKYSTSLPVISPGISGGPTIRIRNHFDQSWGCWKQNSLEALFSSDKVSMANYRANRLVCEAADRAMQVFGGVGYSRHQPFEHIYRHHRRYRITEGAEEIQIRRVAQRLFGFGRK